MHITLLILLYIFWSTVCIPNRPYKSKKAEQHSRRDPERTLQPRRPSVEHDVGPPKLPESHPPTKPGYTSPETSHEPPKRLDKNLPHHRPPFHSPAGMLTLTDIIHAICAY